MGLDMYLSTKVYIPRTNYNKRTPVPNPAFQQVLMSAGYSDVVNPGDHTGLSLEIPLIYWRKANAIHQWFVRNCAGGEDNCQPMFVSRDALHSLLADCLTVLDDHSVTMGKQLLPPQDGYFFGSTEYDDWYWEDIKYTAEQLRRVLDNPQLGDEWLSFEYTASW